MKRLVIFMALVLLSIGVLSGCDSSNKNVDDNPTKKVEDKKDDTKKETEKNTDIEVKEEDSTIKDKETENIEDIKRTKKEFPVYIVDKNSEKLKKEVREVTVEEDRNGWAVLNALKDTPLAEEYYSTVPSNIEFKGLIIKDGLATVDFDNNGVGVGSSAERAFVDSTILTLTNFDTIDRVKFTINGSEVTNFGNIDYTKAFKASDVELEVENSTSSSTDSNLKEDKTDISKEEANVSNKKEDNVEKERQNLQLYIMDENASKLKKEVRAVAVEEGKIGWAVLGALKDTPTEKGYYSTIPSNVEFKKITIENGLATVHFSDNGVGMGSTGESIFVQSVVLTLTNFDSINSVKFISTNGNGFGHLDMSETYSKNNVNYVDTI